jgi:hypothetical protein
MMAAAVSNSVEEGEGGWGSNSSGSSGEVIVYDTPAPTPVVTESPTMVGVGV